MTFLDLLRLSWTNLWGNLLRTLLTIFGIAIGISAIVFLYSLGTGLQELTIQRITQSEALTTLDVNAGGSAIINLSERTKNEFRTIEHVEAVSPSLAVSGQARANDITTDIAITGVEPVYSNLQGLNVRYGSFLTSENDTSSAILSSSLVKLLGLDTKGDSRAALNRSINLTVFVPQSTGESKKEVKDFIITGIVEDDTQTIAYIGLKYLTGLGITDYTGLKVKVKSLNEVATVKQVIADAGYTVTSISDLIGQIKRVFAAIQLILAGFGIIALSVASIGMFNTMTIALLERTRDIGIMRAVGARPRDVRRLFIAEATLIGGIGGLLGIVFAYIFSTIVSVVINTLARQTGSDTLDLFVFPPGFILAIIVFSIVVGLITGIYPAVRAARLNPLHALRYE